MAEPDHDLLVKQHIHTALSDRSTRVGVLIVEGIANSIDLIEEQPTAVIEAVSEHADKLLREEPKSPRREIREAFKKYCQHVLEAAKTRERRLYHGLTGVPELDEGCDDLMKDH